MESETHISLCKLLRNDMQKWIGVSGSTLWETGTIAFRELPATSKISGFKPDLKAYSGLKDFCVLGDAKTAQDIDNKHTKAQLFAFLGFRAEYKNFSIFYRVPSNCYHTFCHFVKGLNLPKKMQNCIYINNIFFTLSK